MIFNLPDLGKVPRFARRAGSDDAAAETRGARAFNRALDRQVDALRDDGLTVTEVDMHRLLDRVFANPRAYGLANVTIPCLDAEDNPCTPRQARRRAFFDNLHPNYVFHRRIAETALAALAAPAPRAAAPASAPIAPGAGAAAAGGRPAPRRDRGARGLAGQAPPQYLTRAIAVPAGSERDDGIANELGRRRPPDDGGVHLGAAAL